jgi:hypothetical protein
MILIYTARPEAIEKTARVHLLWDHGLPACGVMGQDNPRNGLVRALRLSMERKEVTCKRCLRVGPPREEEGR